MLEELDRRVAWHNAQFGSGPSYIYLTHKEFDLLMKELKKHMIQGIAYDIGNLHYRGIPVKSAPHG